MDQVTQPSRFYDRDPGGPVQVQIEQVDASYRVLRQLGYRDPRYQQPFIVPADVETFRTDLASIPWMFAWLVPGLGTHLPAVLLHDGLVVGRGQEPTHVGPKVDRVEADRILRDAMASLGMPRLFRAGSVRRRCSAVAACSTSRMRAARSQAWGSAERLYPLDEAGRCEYVRELDGLVSVLAYMITRPMFPLGLAVWLARRFEQRDPRAVTRTLLGTGEPGQARG